MIFRTLLFQTLIGLLSLALVIWLSLDAISLILGWLLAQGYSVSLFFLGKLTFKGKAKGITLSVISLKWFFVVFVLYGFLQFVEPGSFFIGLSSLVSFFMFYGYLNRG